MTDHNDDADMDVNMTEPDFGSKPQCDNPMEGVEHIAEVESSAQPATLGTPTDILSVVLPLDLTFVLRSL